MTIQLDDDFSIHSLRYGDEKSSRVEFGKLYKGYGKALINFGLTKRLSGPEAEDAAIEALMALWLARERMESIDHIRNFLFRVVLNKSINLQKKKLTEQKYIQRRKDDEEFSDAMEDPMELAIGVKEEEVLISLVMEEVQKWEAASMAEELPVRYKNIFILQYAKNWSVVQIAKELGISTKTVHSNCYYALNHLRKIFGKKK